MDNDNPDNPQYTEEYNPLGKSSTKHHLPSGKRLRHYGKIHNFSWENSRFRLGHFQ